MSTYECHQTHITLAVTFTSYQVSVWTDRLHNLP